MIHRKVICVLLLFPAVHLGAFSRTKMRTENVLYTVVSEKKADMNAVEKFDESFSLNAEEIFAVLGVKTPEQFDVTLCFGAWLFKNETGYDEYTAGLFMPLQKKFVFQNPSVLLKKGILEKTIRHELSHAALAEWRIRRNIEYDSKKIWLEECFCTALFPADDYSAQDGSSLYASLGGSESKIAEYLQKVFSLKSYSERRRGYSLAYFYGKLIFDEKGINGFLGKFNE